MHKTCLAAVAVINNTPPALELGIVAAAADGRWRAAVLAGPAAKNVRHGHQVKEKGKKHTYWEENSTAARFLESRGCGGGCQFFLRKLLTLQWGNYLTTALCGSGARARTRQTDPPHLHSCTCHPSHRA